MKNKVYFDAILSEMAGGVDKFNVEVPISQDVNLEELTKGDADPMFVTVEAVNEGISKNKVEYTKEVISKISQQVITKKPDGYAGHIPESERRNKNPKALTIWLGSAVQEVAGKTRMFIKGYVLPYATELKQYLKAAKASGKKVAVSIYGQAVHNWNQVKEAYEIVADSFNLESIDWARSASPSIDTTGFLKLAAEQGEGDTGTRLEVVQSISTQELKANNPKVVNEMLGELKNGLHDVVKNEVVAEMKGEIQKKEETFISEFLDLKIAREPSKVRPVLRKMVIQEMKGLENTLDNVKIKLENVLNSEEYKTIKEMAGPKEIVVKHDNRGQGEGRSFTVISSN